jgi:hypothetical protein
VTASFNLNLLARINQELRATFDCRRFAHRAVWNEKESRLMREGSMHEQMEPPGPPPRQRVLHRVKRAGCEITLVYRGEIAVEELPPLMRKGAAVAFLAQRLDLSPATLYRHGIAAMIPVEYQAVRQLRDGRLKPSEARVRREALLRFYEALTGTKAS